MLERQIGEQVGSDDLRAPTARKESWGRGTRRHAQSDWIEDQLTASGWRAVDSAAVLRVPEVAARPGNAETHTRRLMREGIIPAHTRTWGKRHVWVAYERDVDQYLQMTGVTLAEIGAEVGDAGGGRAHGRQLRGPGNHLRRTAAAVRSTGLAGVLSSTSRS